MNIVTIKSEFVPKEIAHQFGLVSATHDENNKWQKIVVMDHVEIDDLEPFVNALNNFKISI